MGVSFRVKIIAGTALVVTTVIATSGAITHRYFTRIVAEQGVKDGRTKLALVSASLKRLQEQTAKTASYIAAHEEIASIGLDDSQKTYFRKVAFQDTLKRYVALNSYLINVLILREDGAIFSNNPGYEPYFRARLSEPWFLRFRERGARSGFTGMHEFFYLNRAYRVFSYVMDYRAVGEANFVLVLDVVAEELEGAFRGTEGDFEYVELLDAAGERLFSEGPAPRVGAVAAGEDFASGMPGSSVAEGSDRILLVDRSMLDGWLQVASLSKAVLFSRVREVLGVYLAVLAATVAILLSIFLPWAINITRPVALLSAAMRRASSGDLSVRVDIKTGDDMELLGTGFNRMIVDLDRFISRSIELEKTERRMEIGLLMAQVNPHFLYNALNTVIYLCSAGRAADAAGISRSLIAILQASLSAGSDPLLRTVEEELELTDRYLEIQAYRYPDRFDFVRSVDGTSRGARLPRMTIQPLVENALFHGIGPLERRGRIELRVARIGDELVVSVEDDGVGMGSAKLRSVLEGSAASSVSDPLTRIGLRNIRDRVEHQFGTSYGLSAEGGSGRGTVVTLRVPYLPPIS